MSGRKPRESFNPEGNLFLTPIQSALDAYAKYRERLEKDPGDVAAQIMLSKLDPTRLELFAMAKKRSQKLVEKHLKYWMFRENPGNFTKIPHDLLDTNKYPAHGQLIDHEEANDLGLTVEFVESESKLWQEVWKLYMLSRLGLDEREKLIESRHVSMPLTTILR